MKKICSQMLYGFVLLACTTLLFTACKKEAGQGFKTYTVYTPTYQSKAAVLAGINGNPAEPVTHAGKIYIKDNFIYLNDVNKGIHIIDNSNPASPVQVAFLALPGNVDIAIKQNILYADMYADLLTLDISNPRNAVIRNTIPGFFSNRTWVHGYASEVNDQIAVSWAEKDTSVPVLPRNCDFCLEDFANGGPMLATSSSSTGTAGSMAAMVLMNDYLYAITESHSVGVVDISNAAAPVQHSNFYAGFDLETVYPFKGKLFLGSKIGMFMYDVTNPANPVALGQFSHGRACDPVIADDNNAYVTLHAGDGCGGTANELHVLDIRDIQNSSLIKTYPMTKPTGLSKDGNFLFVCDGNAVKIFNTTNPGDLGIVKQINSNEPYDVIASNRRAIVVCADGLYQYDYSNFNAIRQLSFIAAKK